MISLSCQFALRWKVTHISSMDESLCLDYSDVLYQALWSATCIWANDDLESMRFVLGLRLVAPFLYNCHALPFCMDRASTMVSMGLCLSSERKHRSEYNQLVNDYSCVFMCVCFLHKPEWTLRAWKLLMIQIGKTIESIRVIIRYDVPNTPQWVIPNSSSRLSTDIVTQNVKRWNHLMIHFQCHLKSNSISFDLSYISEHIIQKSYDVYFLASVLHVLYLCARMSIESVHAIECNEMQQTRQFDTVTANIDHGIRSLIHCHFYHIIFVPNENRESHGNSV